MPLMDGRVPGVDLLFSPSTTRIVQLAFPDGYLADRSFTATLGEADLDVEQTSDTVLAVTLPATITAGAPIGQRLAWTLLQDGEPIIAGSWQSSDRPGIPDSTTATVLDGDIIVQVSLLGADGDGAVESVNGQTGAVVLTAADVGADPEGSAAAVASDLADHEADDTAHGDPLAALATHEAELVAHGQVAPMSAGVSASAMRAGAGTPGEVTAINGLPGWELAHGDSVVFDLPPMPDVHFVELDILVSFTSSTLATTLGGSLGRSPVGEVLASGTSITGEAVPLSDTSQYPAGSLVSAGLGYDTSGQRLTVDPREATGLELTATAAFGGTVVVHEVRPRDNRFERLLLMKDAIGSWWTRPRSVGNPDGNNITVTGISSRGRIELNRQSNVTQRPLGLGSRVIVASNQEDDHNNPALVFPLSTTNRPAVIFWTQHAVDALMRYRVATTPGLLGSLASQPTQTIDYSSIATNITYAEAHSRPTVGSGEIHLLTRVGLIGGGTGWAYTRSTDWAGSWSAPVTLFHVHPFGLHYVASTLLADGQTLRYVGFLHPSDFLNPDTHDLWAWEIDLTTGDVTPIGGGTVLGNVQTGAGLPLTSSTAPRVYTTPVGRTVHGFDISSGPAPTIVFAEKDLNNLTTENSVYKVLRWDGNGWQATTVAATGLHFQHVGGYYVGGGAFPIGTDDRLYLSRSHGGEWQGGPGAPADGTQTGALWTIERWTTPDSGATWSLDEVIDRLDQPLIRPFAVEGTSSVIEATYYRAERYDGPEAGRFFTHVYGIPAV
jgi:hypothetical protein